MKMSPEDQDDHIYVFGVLNERDYHKGIYDRKICKWCRGNIYDTTPEDSIHVSELWECTCTTKHLHDEDPWNVPQDDSDLIRVQKADNVVVLSSYIKELWTTSLEDVIVGKTEDITVVDVQDAIAKHTAKMEPLWSSMKIEAHTVEQYKFLIRTNLPLLSNLLKYITTEEVADLIENCDHFKLFLVHLMKMWGWYLSLAKTLFCGVPIGAQDPDFDTSNEEDE